MLHNREKTLHICPFLLVLVCNLQKVCWSQWRCFHFASVAGSIPCVDAMMQGWLMLRWPALILDLGSCSPIHLLAQVVVVVCSCLPLHLLFWWHLLCICTWISLAGLLYVIYSCSALWANVRWCQLEPKALHFYCDFGVNCGTIMHVPTLSPLAAIVDAAT